MPNERREWCETCQNNGEVDCHCGGDLCTCENYGVMPCPDCLGGDLIMSAQEAWEYQQEAKEEERDHDR